MLLLRQVLPLVIGAEKSCCGRRLLTPAAALKDHYPKPIMMFVAVNKDEEEVKKD